MKEVVLETMEPVPGQCERGFVLFQTPRGERPELVVFEEQFKAEREAPPIRWAVPDEQNAGPEQTAGFRPGAGQAWRRTELLGLL